MEQAREFLRALRTDPRAKELLSERQIPESDAEASEAYAEIAGKLGYALTAEQIAAEAESIAQELLAASAEAEDDARELDSQELEMVVGGDDDPCKNHQHYSCSSTFEDGEWCWFSDACETIINKYAGYP